MSRVGKKPITIPDKATITYKNRVITVKGPKGTLTRTIHPSVDLKIADGILNVTIDTVNKINQAFQGMTRSLVANMFKGVFEGFERVLEINGIGYKAAVQGKNIELVLGYSHTIKFELPEGISAKIDKNTIITLSGIDKEVLGQTAASIRKLRPPEPYKGKGIKYAEERIIRKAGKTGTA